MGWIVLWGSQCNKGLYVQKLIASLDYLASSRTGFLGVASAVYCQLFYTQVLGGVAGLQTRHRCEYGEKRGEPEMKVFYSRGLSA